MSAEASEKVESASDLSCSHNCKSVRFGQNVVSKVNGGVAMPSAWGPDLAQLAQLQKLQPVEQAILLHGVLQPID